MNILLSNDDGYRAEGIVALYNALRQIEGIHIEVVAPEHNQSAKSNALTLNAPVYVHASDESRTLGFRYATGTPADCVHIALTGLLGYTPDLVVSGINNGANMGDDTLYSGTVGAAMEGYLFGIPAIAFSQAEKGWKHLDAAAEFSARFVADRLAQIRKGAASSKPTANAPYLLNVNVPVVPKDQIKGLQVTRLGKRHAAEPVIKQQSPRGETMYWIGAAGPAKDADAGTDFHAVHNGLVSVTPLQVDLTDTTSQASWIKALA